MKSSLLRAGIGALALAAQLHAGSTTSGLWQLCQESAATHRYSTLFTAHDVKNQLATAEGRARAKQWLHDTGVTKVYVETFRDGYEANDDALQTARDEFRKAGLQVSGCVTTTDVGRKSTGWKIIACYTDQETQNTIKRIFEKTARLFDEIMVDDFWFTDCACPDCEAARQARTVRIGGKSFPVNGDRWEDYRCELMVRLSQENVLAAARRVNPKVQVIIKYPQWYDRFHERGYEVLRETADFDRIWVGTETRDYEDKRWGGTVQYEAYFIMRWLGGIGKEKCGGGWYDWLGTTEKTYIEQARQTVLAGAKESLLFCFGGLQSTTGPKNIDALRVNIPELQSVAAEVQKRVPAGIAAWKPANSHPENEPRIFDFVGMLGLPLLPCHEFPANAPAAFFSAHSLKDPKFKGEFSKFVKSGKPVLITDGLLNHLSDLPEARASNVQVLPAKGSPKSVMEISRAELDALRRPLLAPFHASFQAPAKVALYLFKDGSWVIENFNESDAVVQIGPEELTIPARSWKITWK